MASSETVGHPRLFNDSYCDGGHGSGWCFSLFSRLPGELRLMIWHAFLRGHRVIHIRIDIDHFADRSAFPYTKENHLGNVKSGGVYSLRLGPHHWHQTSPLLRVNSEARAAALAFYRVHLPCDQRPGGRLLYFNPEYDFLHVKQVIFRCLMADLLHDCKAYDPKARGILNLIVGGIGDDIYFTSTIPRHPKEVEPQAVEAFRSTLANLRTLYFYHEMTDGRMMLPEIDPEGDEFIGPGEPDASRDRMRFNRGLPLESPLEAFTLVGPDPRAGIRDDLRLVGVRFDPRLSLWAWREVERAFGIVRPVRDGPGAQQLDSRFLFTCPIHEGVAHKALMTRAILTCARAKEYLGAEERWWDYVFTKGACRDVPNPDSPERKTNVLPAFGFWLLDTRAVGEMPEHADWSGWGAGPQRQDWAERRDLELDATKHWPQLGVFHLAPGC